MRIAKRQAMEVGGPEAGGVPTRQAATAVAYAGIAAVGRLERWPFGSPHRRLREAARFRVPPRYVRRTVRPCMLTYPCVRGRLYPPSGAAAPLSMLSGSSGKNPSRASWQSWPRWAISARPDSLFMLAASATCWHGRRWPLTLRVQLQKMRARMNFHKALALFGYGRIRFRR